MRKLFTLAGVLFFAICLFSALSASAQRTVVYIVRHAEKDMSNPGERNPDLSADGKQRALDLAKVLQKEKIDVILSTPFKRTLQTVQPVAERSNLTTITYNPTDFKGLAQKIRKEYAGKTTLVAGHSNTVLEILDALGGKRPVPELTEEDYDYLFKVVVTDDGNAEVEASTYGKSTQKKG